MLSQEAVERLVDLCLQLNFALQLLDDHRVRVRLDLVLDLLVQLAQKLVHQC